MVPRCVKGEKRLCVLCVCSAATAKIIIIKKNRMCSVFSSTLVAHTACPHTHTQTAAEKANDRQTLGYDEMSI